MKILFTLFLFVYTATVFKAVNAGIVIKAKADLVAGNFMISQGFSVSLKSTDNAVVCQTFGRIQAIGGTLAEQPAFYVYNTEKPGFVIISGHDALPPILAYSNENAFDFSNISNGLEALLKDYELMMNNAVRNDMKQSEQVQAEWKRYVQYNEQMKAAYLIDSIKPMTTTKWGYGAPYNNLCPVDPKASVRNGGRAPVGCAAVAMAQVMKYWDNKQWDKVNPQRNRWYTPLKGYGSNLYGSWYGDLSADFGKTNYDWYNMPDIVDNNSPEYQKKAVATLMYHCGVSVNMDYTYNSSGCIFDCDPEPVSYLNCVKKSFTKFWGYSNLIKVQYKSVSDSIWEDMIKKEIVAGRPVIYAGDDGPSKAAHAMVIDGFNKAGLFSINWGLFGFNNGYYRLNSLPLQATETLIFNYINNGMIMTGIEPDHLMNTKEAGLEEQFKIWPNPASDRLHLDLSGFRESQMDIDILNALGVKVSGIRYSGIQTEIPLENLRPGVYIIRVNFRDKTLTRKFIIK